MTWSRSTSPLSSTTGSSSSSFSNSSDSDFSLMRDTGVLRNGAKLKSDSVTTAIPDSVNQVIQLKDRQQHGKNDAHHKKAHEHDEQGPQEAHHGRQDAIELPF